MGWETLAGTSGQAIIIGAGNESTDAPAGLAELACAFAESGQTVVVALDWPDRANTALQSAWEAPSNLFLSTLTRRWPEWKSLDDGRTDIAVMAMTERLHEMKSSGFPIIVTTYEAYDDSRTNEAILRTRSPESVRVLTLEGPNSDQGPGAYLSQDMTVTVATLTGNKLEWSK